MNLGAAIDKLYHLREQKRLHENEIKMLNQTMAEEEENILAMLQEVGTTISSGAAATVSITEQVLPIIDDAEAFFDHIQETGDFHLLERRPSARAYREMLEAGEDVPGLRKFVKRKLSLRTK